MLFCFCFFQLLVLTLHVDNSVGDGEVGVVEREGVEGGQDVVEGGDLVVLAAL